VIDFRLAVERSVRELPAYTLEKWILEGDFRSNMDVVEFNAPNSEGRTVRMKRGVCPDAYFEIVNEELRANGKPHKARFLLEMDMATHDNPGFGKYKALPGVAYIKSAAYKERFGNNHGLWLVVTSGGQRRMMNLMKQTEERVGEDAKFFYFTSLAKAMSENFLLASIWNQAGSSQPVALVRNHEQERFLRR
jgi:hypothetical protein